MKIRHVKAVSRFSVEVAFEDGVGGIVDLGDLAGRGVFSEWLKDGVFESVKVTSSGALEWPGELDLCADSIYLRLTGKVPEELAVERIPNRVDRDAKLGEFLLGRLAQVERGDFSSKSVMEIWSKTKKANGLGWLVLDQAPDVPPLPGDELLEE
jgi:hypothetical protein